MPSRALGFEHEIYFFFVLLQDLTPIFRAGNPVIEFDLNDKCCRSLPYTDPQLHVLDVFG